MVYSVVEGEGIILRETFGSSTPRVEYSLTEKGSDSVYVIESRRSYDKGWLCDMEAH